MRTALAAIYVGLLLPTVAAAQDIAVGGREAAQAAYASGQHKEAKRILAGLLAESPDDPDLLRRMASVTAALQDLDSAQRLIDRAYALAPQDADIQLARANILLWRGELGEARTQADLVRTISPDYPGLVQFTNSADHAARDRRVGLRSASIGGALSNAEFQSGNTSSWTAQRASVSIGQTHGIIATFGAEREDRGLVDTRFTGRVDFPSGENRLFLGASATPDADFRENWSLSAGGEFDAASSITLLLDGRFAEYRTGDVGVIGAGVRQNFGRRFALTGRTINLLGGGEDYRFGGSLRADYEVDSGPGLFAIIASYPDAEVDGTRQLRAVAGGARIDLNRNIVMRVSGEYEKRDQSYERVAFGLDFTWMWRGP